MIVHIFKNIKKKTIITKYVILAKSFRSLSAEKKKFFAVSTLASSVLIRIKKIKMIMQIYTIVKSL